MIFFVLNRFETSKPLDLMSIAQREETSLPEEIVDDEGMTHTIGGGGGGGDAGGEEDEDLPDPIFIRSAERIYHWRN